MLILDLCFPTGRSANSEENVCAVHPTWEEGIVPLGMVVGYLYANSVFRSTERLQVAYESDRAASAQLSRKQVLYE